MHWYRRLACTGRFLHSHTKVCVNHKGDGCSKLESDMVRGRVGKGGGGVAGSWKNYYYRYVLKVIAK